VVRQHGDDGFTHTVRLEDDARGIELRADCVSRRRTRSRGPRRVLEATSRPSAGRVVTRLAGTRMVGGFGRRLAELVGAGEGAALLIDAAIEVARLARQVAKIPAAITAAIAPATPRRAGRSTSRAWAIFRDRASRTARSRRALLASRASSDAVAVVLQPSPGAERVFERRKLARLVRTGERLHLFSSMHDDVHGFDLHYEIDLAAARSSPPTPITSRCRTAGSATSRSPRARDGRRAVDALLRKRSQDPARRRSWAARNCSI
jgi:hypothetical protein